MVQPLQRRLGRGLASLIGDATPGEQRLPPEGEHRVVGIDQLFGSSLNPRREFREDDVLELAESIRQKGLVQPIIVRPDPQGTSTYEIVAGERRWRACQKAGIHNIPVIVRELDDQQVLELAIIENVQRIDLNPVEEAGGYNQLVERFGYTQETLADVIGKSRSHVSNTMRLLKLPEAIQKLVLQGTLSPGHARPLVGLENAEEIAQRIVEQGLSVREVEALIAELSGTAEKRRKREKDADTRAMEKVLADSLGLKVEIKPTSGESGSIIIKYGNFDQLEYLGKRLIGNGSVG